MTLTAKPLAAKLRKLERKHQYREAEVWQRLSDWRNAKRQIEKRSWQYQQKAISAV